jgi:uncharacterized membrane protein SpoIIM required for sporulation
LKEIVFINNNTERWKALEEILGNPGKVSPEKLSGMYFQLTDDLAYARTYFPQSKITLYLNNLTVKVHHLIYKNKKISKKGFIDFWKNQYPAIIKEYQRYILYAFLIMIISAAIGALSATYDKGFVRLILGDSYVNMTLENIKNKEPLAVYKAAGKFEMFLGITLNNIRVSFMAYIAGIILSVGSGYILFQNGVLLGAFLQLFYSYGLLKDCILTVFIHGTLEIFAITVAGAAGLVLGNSIIFPGTFKRIVSFRKGVHKSIQMLAGLIPVFIIAGFLEGFVTRYTNMPDTAKFSIIICSLLLIGFYFIYYPIKQQNQMQYGKHYSNQKETRIR